VVSSKFVRCPMRGKFVRFERGPATVKSIPWAEPGFSLWHRDPGGLVECLSYPRSVSLGRCDIKPRVYSAEY
jgi:hypothetical protein